LLANPNLVIPARLSSRYVNFIQAVEDFKYLVLFEICLSLTETLVVSCCKLLAHGVSVRIDMLIAARNFSAPRNLNMILNIFV